jgi:hypothetical protein
VSPNDTQLNKPSAIRPRHAIVTTPKRITAPIHSVSHACQMVADGVAIAGRSARAIGGGAHASTMHRSGAP